MEQQFAREIFITKKEANANIKTIWKRPQKHFKDFCSSACLHRPRGQGGKNGFVGQTHGSTDLGSFTRWLPASGVFQLQLGIKEAQVHLELSLWKIQTISLDGLKALECKSNVCSWLSLPRFYKMYGKAWMSREKPSASVDPSQETSTIAIWGQTWGWRPHKESPLGYQLVEQWKGWQLSSRLENGRSTCSLHCAPRRVLGA